MYVRHEADKVHIFLTSIIIDHITLRYPEVKSLLNLACAISWFAFVVAIFEIEAGSPFSKMVTTKTNEEMQCMLLEKFL